VDAFEIVVPILLVILFAVALWWIIVALKGYKYVNGATQTRGISSLENNGTTVAISCPSNDTIKVNDTYLMCADVSENKGIYSANCNPFNADGSVIAANVIDVTSALASQLNGKTGQVSATLNTSSYNNPCTGNPCQTWSINGSYDCVPS